MRDKTFVMAYKPAWGDTIQVLIMKHEDGKVYEADEIRWKEVSPAMLAAPTLYLFREDAQLLMDELWNCGLRPTEGAGSAGALAATQQHLEDMRRLVFKEKYERLATARSVNY